ncbi:MAG: zinc-binding alcohol dehydrogenase family protein [Oceanospirillaceae bacterium]|jgi:zinc-binding alcohol dehydrogenase family protein
MKSVGYTKSLAISHDDSLVDIELAQPIAAGHDVLVKITAIAVNPVDTKIRRNVTPTENEHRVLGWDAVGEIVARGDDASAFDLGDVIYYAGALNRQGCNSEYQLVDERLIALKPKSLSAAQAAALPLTTITAWEMLFDHLNIKQQPAGDTIRTGEIVLVVGAAGGVGSILLQILKAITGATIIATASRISSQAWVRKLGADYVIDHNNSLTPQIEALNIGQVTHVASLNGTDSYLDSYADFMAPFGKIATIDGSSTLDVTKLKLKCLSLHYEFMFTRSMYQTADMDEQGRLLKRVADLVDQGFIQTTIGKNLGTINANNLKAAHQELEAGTSIGKIVLEGF